MQMDTTINQESVRGSFYQPTQHETKYTYLNVYDARQPHFISDRTITIVVVTGETLSQTVGSCPNESVIQMRE